MEQFRIEVADNQGFGHFFNIKSLNHEIYQIYDDQLKRMATIEIDPRDQDHFRQSLDCSIELPLLDSIKNSILLHEELVH